MTGASLRRRSLLGALVWITLALGFGEIIIKALFERAALAQFDKRHRDHLDLMAAAIVNPSQQEFDGRLTNPRFSKPYGGFYWMAAGPGGATFQSRSLFDVPFPALAQQSPPPALGALRVHANVQGPDGQRLRLLEQRLRVGDTDQVWTLVVGADQAELEEVNEAFTTALSLSMAALGAALMLAAWAQVHITLGPLAALRQAAADHRAGRTARLVGDFPREAAPLVNDLNDVLDRNEKLVAQARRRAADLAHDMKTPIAILRNELEAMKGEDAERLAVALEALGRIEAQTRRQLARARFLVGSSAAQPPTPVAPIAERLARVLPRLHERAPKMRLEIGPEAAFLGDGEDLEELLGELANNACTWAAGEVLISARMAASEIGRRLILQVEDDGPGAEPSDYARMLAPGGRLDSRRPGSGLGLAIVSDLAEAYGGAIRLGRSRLGGLSVTADLPAPASQA